METGDSPATAASDAFVAELSRWRAERGLSKKQLAAQMGFDPSYVSHVEARRHRPTADFARRAEQVLQAGGALWRQFREYDELRSAERGIRLAAATLRDPPAPEQSVPSGAPSTTPETSRSPGTSSGSPSTATPIAATCPTASTTSTRWTGPS
jgi:transcriptional regulator with XRE-family HTH domain